MLFLCELQQEQFTGVPVLKSINNRRFATNKQRTAVYILSGGRCQICDEPLKPGWHVDHVRPWIKGGATDILNLQATCPTCNRTKGCFDMITLREPQARAIEALRTLSRNGQEVDFFDPDVKKCSALLAMAPASGKTILALFVAVEAIRKGAVDYIVVDAPKSVSNHWRTAAMAVEKSTGIKLQLDVVQHNTDMPLDPEYRGYITNYSAVNSNPDIHRGRTASTPRRPRKAFVIIDESHHLCENGQAWGKTHLQAFSDASRILLLSGTPWRSKPDQRLAWARYCPADSDGLEAVAPDFEYGIGKATAAGLVRVPRAVFLGMKHEFSKVIVTRSVSGAVVGTETIKMKPVSMADNLNAKDVPPVLRAYIQSGWKEALKEGFKVRQKMVRAGDKLAKIGVTANSIEDAERIANWCIEKHGAGSAIVVTSADDGSSEKLAAFNADPTAWIVVSVDMLGEGYDAPNLRAMVWLTTTRTPMAFIQRGYRAGRMRPNDLALGFDEMVLILPDLPVFHELFEQIKQPRCSLVSAESILDDGDETVGPDSPDGPVILCWTPPPEPRRVQPVEAVDPDSPQSGPGAPGPGFNQPGDGSGYTQNELIISEGSKLESVFHAFHSKEDGFLGQVPESDARHAELWADSHLSYKAYRESTAYDRFRLWEEAGRPVTSQPEPEPEPEPDPIDVRAETDRLYTAGSEAEKTVRAEFFKTNLQGHLSKPLRARAASIHISVEIRRRAGLAAGQGKRDQITYEQAKRYQASAQDVLNEAIKGDWSAFNNPDDLKFYAERAARP